MIENRADGVPDAARLRRRAYHYLQRYAASEAQLAAVMQRRLERDARKAGLELDREAAARAIAEVVAHCRDLGIVDDRSFAETKVAAGRRKGHSANRLKLGLGAKGVDRDLVTEALAGADTDEARAALVFARRKRLGPWRRRQTDDPRAADRRDMAALCRNGFSVALARRVVTLTLDQAESELESGDTDPRS